MQLKRGGWWVMALSGIATAAMAAAQSNAPAAPAPARADTGIEPFSGHYVAEWKDITVGTSDLKLERDALPDHYHYKWTISARGIFRLVYSDDVTQESWFGIVDDHIRPDRYRASQGSSTVSFDFDWNSGHARGSSENKPIDLELQQGAQDLMSIQVEIMLDLKNGNMPSVFHIIDKDQMKEFLYTREGSAKLRTALGEIDTIIVASRRSATDSRVLRMWFAPSLGFVPLQAERTRDGKLEFAIRIKSLQR
jgi:hypothetical protein